MKIKTLGVTLFVIGIVACSFIGGSKDSVEMRLFGNKSNS